MHTVDSLGALLRLAATTHLRASALSRSNGWFTRWHERRFTRTIARFIDGLESLPQSAAQRITAQERAGLGERIDAVIADVERFVARHHAGSLKRIERNRYLVKDIYHLRAAFETLARGATADPQFEDMRWELKVDPTHTGPGRGQPR
jgi:hypothetical protein